MVGIICNADSTRALHSILVLDLTNAPVDDTLTTMLQTLVKSLLKRVKVVIATKKGTNLY